METNGPMRCRLDTITRCLFAAALASCSDSGAVGDEGASATPSTSGTTNGAATANGSITGANGVTASNATASNGVTTFGSATTSNSVTGSSGATSSSGPIAGAGGVLGGQLTAAVQDYAVTLDSELYSLQVLLEPGAQGTNLLHLYAYTPDGERQPVLEWQATAALPEAGVEPIDIPVLALTDEHATGQVVLPTAGDWQFRFTLRLSEFDQAAVEATVLIK